MLYQHHIFFPPSFSTILSLLTHHCSNSYPPPPPPTSLFMLTHLPLSPATSPFQLRPMKVDFFLLPWSIHCIFCSWIQKKIIVFISATPSLSFIPTNPQPETPSKPQSQQHQTALYTILILQNLSLSLIFFSLIE